MLQATQQLLQRKDAFASSYELQTAYAAVVVSHGSLEDAQALVPLYLSDPDKYTGLLEVFMAHGDEALAKRLFNEYLACEKKAPIRTLHTHALHCIGYLRLQEAASYLWEKSKPFQADGSLPAALGLLNLDCSSIKKEIASEIRSHKGKFLFPEILPALAYKTDDLDLLAELFAWGNGDLPQACNGGLVLGIALFADAGEQLFRKLLWSKRWDVLGGGTGTDHSAYLGIRTLGLKFHDLFLELKALDDEEAQPLLEYRISVLRCMLQIHCEEYWRPYLRAIKPPTESFEELLALTCYDSRGNENTLLELATSRLGCSSRPVELIHNLRDVFSALVAQDLERTELLARTA